MHDQTGFQVGFNQLPLLAPATVSGAGRAARTSDAAARRRLARRSQCGGTHRRADTYVVVKTARRRHHRARVGAKPGQPGDAVGLALDPPTPTGSMPRPVCVASLRFRRCVPRGNSDPDQRRPCRGHRSSAGPGPRDAGQSRPRWRAPAHSRRGCSLARQKRSNFTPQIRVSRAWSVVFYIHQHWPCSARTLCS